MADAIFISYRRDDSEGESGRLFDDLTRAFGKDAVFMDVAGIKPGADFRKAIEDNVASCGVFLAMVGPAWATIKNSDGIRRLDDPTDFVALEIASALRREVPVIPVLVHDAKMPAVALLPDHLKPFAYRNSVELSHPRWNSDVALLIEALKAYVTPKSASESPVHATVPVQLPAPHHPTGTIVPAVQRSWKPALIGALAGIVLIVAIIAYFLFKPVANTASVTPAVHSAANAPRPVAPVNAPVNSAPAPPVSAYVGTWMRTGGKGDMDALGELVITNSANGLLVRAYGRCQAPACDWGQQPGTVQGAALVATFAPPPNGSDTSRTSVVTIEPVQGGLDVLVHNKFQNPAGPRGSSSHRLFTAAR